jgi:hypothetical protein
MEHKHMTEQHRLIIEKVFDKYTKLLEEACMAGCHSAVDMFMDIVKDADHILRKNTDK